MKRVVNATFAKGKGEYEKVINSIEKIGHCPFCPENFNYHKKEIVKNIGNWFITENSWPYKNAKKHFLIISKNHKENFSDLSLKDFSEIKKIVNFAIKKFNIKGGALALRFGDTNYTGATVCHLHFHLIMPELGIPSKPKTVIFPIG